MNAIEIIEQVRAFDADLFIENDKLMVRGKGDRLPNELTTALREQKAAVMVALGAPLEAAIASVLDEIRPHLTPELQDLSDANLLALVNWTILHAWGKAVRSVKL